MLKAGNDITPSVAGVRGVSALSKGGSGYGSQSISRALRTLYSFGYGFSGRGPHSFVGTFNLAVENEDFNDGSSNRMRAVRSDLRYNFQGKYGVDFYVLRYRRWDFTDASGVEHPIPLDTGFAVRLLYSLAVNFACYIEGGNLQNAKLNQNWREGNYWNVNLQFLW